MALFQSRGPVPEWRALYDQIYSTANYGEIVTFAQMEQVLGRPFLPNRHPVYRVRKELGDRRQMWIEAVKNVGYRVIRPNEHLRVANDHKRRGKYQLGLMQTVGEVTNLSRLTPEELSAFDSQAKINSALYLVACHHESRLLRIEEILAKEGLI